MRGAGHRKTYNQVGEQELGTSRAVSPEEQQIQYPVSTHQHPVVHLGQLFRRGCDVCKWWCCRGSMIGGARSRSGSSGRPRSSRVAFARIQWTLSACINLLSASAARVRIAGSKRVGSCPARGASGGIANDWVSWMRPEAGIQVSHLFCMLC